MLRHFLWAIRLISAERRSLRLAAKFALRGLVYPVPTLRLLRYFAQVAPSFPSRRVQVDALLKIGREHVRLGLTADERVDLLIAHYTTLMRGIGDAALASFLKCEPIRLARMTDTGDAYDISLSHTPFGYRREGEATISVQSCATGIRLADLTFCIGRMPTGALCLRIGGIQGPPPPLGKDAVKAATKSLDGLRPKCVAMEAVYQLGRYFGTERVLATALSSHILYGKKAPRMHLGSYDAFWEELGGVRLACGDYLLPDRLPHRVAAEVPAKRRKDWERRQQRIEALTSEIQRTMQALQPMGLAAACDPRPARSRSRTLAHHLPLAALVSATTLCG